MWTDRQSRQSIPFHQITGNCPVISSIEISRFRGIREGKLEDLTPLVVLAGANGCGKSSILDAILIGASPSISKAVDQSLRRHPGVKEGIAWLLWRKGFKGSSDITLSANGRSFRCCKLRDPGRNAIKVETIDDQRGTRRGVLNLSQGVVEESPAGEPLDDERLAEVRLIEGHGSDPERELDRLYTDALDQGQLDEVHGFLRHVVPTLKTLTMGSESGRTLIYFDFGDHGVPAALTGDGVHSLVRLSLELATQPQGTTLLEEPEVHQHTGAIRQAMRAVLAAVRRDIQVILTTHSLELIDALLAESSDEDVEKLSLYRLELEDGRLISVRMPGSEVAFSRQKIEDDLR